MNMHEIKSCILYSDAHTPQEVIDQAFYVGHGRLLRDMMVTIYHCYKKRVKEKYQKRVAAISHVASQAFLEDGASLRTKYAKKIASLIHKVEKRQGSQVERKEVLLPLPKDGVQSEKKALKLSTEPSFLVGRGLQNGGNTCYANAVIKLLLLSTAWKPFLVQRTSPLALALRDVQERLCCQKEWATPLLVSKGSLSILFREIRRVFPNISSGAPQDAEELMRCLLDHVGYEPFKLCVTTLVEGVEIEKKEAFYSIIPLHLEALKRSGGDSLQDLLDRSTEIQRIDEQDVAFHTKLSLDRKEPPPVLFLNLIRYYSVLDAKRNVSLEMSKQSISIPGYLFFQREENESVAYHLKGVVLHRGGHYFMLEMTNDGWVCHNDSHISRMAFEEAMRTIDRDGVLFSYEKVG